MAGEVETLCERGRPAGANEFQVAFLGWAIDFVADHRMSGMGRVDADLVGAAGEGFRLDERKRAEVVFEFLEDAKLGHRQRAARMDHSLEVDFGLQDLAPADDRGIDGESFRPWVAGEDREVGLPDFPLLHSDGGLACGGGGFGNEDHAARFAVETVDERNLAAVRDLVGEKFAQAVPQRLWPARLARVDQQAGGFVHGEQVGRFAENPELCLISHRFAETLAATMIELRHLTRTYSSGTGVVRALDNVSLDLAPGDFATITGPSGCGKSTLLNLLGGLDTPTSGEIRVDGLELHRAGERELTHYRRHTLGIVFQFFNLLPAMTVRENVELPLLLRGDSKKKSSARVSEMLDLVGMAHREGHFPHQLSGGEMQRVAIARALAGRPALLLADEPTGNLDSANAAHVCETFSKIASQKIATLIIVTHSDSVAALAPVRIHMIDGTILSKHVINHSV